MARSKTKIQKQINTDIKQLNSSTTAYTEKQFRTDELAQKLNKLYIDIKRSGTSSFIYGEMDDSGDDGRLNINSILKLRSRTSYPTSPTPEEGDMVRLKDHSTLSDGYYVYNGSNWISIIQW